MSDETNIDPLDDDQEMLDAIAAAFGPDAVELLQDDISADGETSLTDVVRDIDSNLVADGSSQNDASGKQEDEVETDRYIMVEIGGAKFGVPMCNVLEIQRVPPITLLPNVPSWVNGVVNLRGTILSVADLQMILKLPPTEVAPSARRLIVTQSLLDEVDAGLIVDRVLGIRGVRRDQIESPTAPVSEDIAAYMHGVYAFQEDMIGLLDIEKLLLSDSFRQFEAV